MEILGTPTELSVQVGRTLSDSDYGSFKGAATLTVSLAPDANLKDVFDSIQAWLEVAVGKAIKAQKKAYDLNLQLQPAADIDIDARSSFENPSQTLHVDYGIADSRATPPDEGPPNFPDSGAETPVADSSGQMVTETWQRPTLTVEFTKAGDKYLRVKGGKWKKFGAPAWTETIPFTYFTDWNPGQEYQLPDGLQEVIVQMNEKGQPKKVIGFQ